MVSTNAQQLNEYASLPTAYEIQLPHPYCPKIDDPNHAVMLTYPNDCKKYFSCLGGYAYEKKCPENFFWSPITYRCDRWELSSCANGFNGVNSMGGKSYGEPPTAATEPSISKYSNVPIIQHIPPTPIVPAIIVDSKQNSDNPINWDAYCQSGGNEYVAFPNDCRKFINCEPTPIILTCPINMYWSQRLLSCDTTPTSCQ